MESKLFRIINRFKFLVQRREDSRGCREQHQTEQLKFEKVAIQRTALIRDFSAGYTLTPITCTALPCTVVVTRISVYTCNMQLAKENHESFDCRIQYQRNEIDFIRLNRTIFLKASPRSQQVLVVVGIPSRYYPTHSLEEQGGSAKPRS